MILQELFDSHIEWEWEGEDTAVFNIDPYQYRVNLTKLTGKTVVDFSITDAEDPTSDLDPFAISGTGNAITVFSTIIRIIKEHLQSEPNQILVFDATEKSRVKLYRRFLKKFGNDWDVEETDKSSGGILFTLTKKVK